MKCVITGLETTRLFRSLPVSREAMEYARRMRDSGAYKDVTAVLRAMHVMTRAPLSRSWDEIRAHFDKKIADAKPI